MATKAFTALLCTFAIVGQMHAQEVMVARETKPTAPEPATQASTSKLSDSESESTSAKKAPDGKKKSAAALPTIEQMRTAGALAAERLKNQARVEKTNTSPAPRPEAAKVQPVPGESPRKEKPIEHSSVPHESKSGTKKLDAVGRIEPVRPTIMESGKPETDSSHPTKDALALEH
jgi:hypothetical protein